MDKPFRRGYYASLDYCSHGKRLLKPPSEECPDCEELWDYMLMTDSLKCLLRRMAKRMKELGGGEL